MLNYTKLNGRKGYASNRASQEAFNKQNSSFVEKLTVTRVYNDKITTAKYGVKDKISIYTEEYPETKMSSLDKSAQGIKVGDRIEVSIEKNGSFTNFKMPKTSWGGGSSTPVIPSQIEERLKRLEEAVFSGDVKTSADTVSDDEPVF